MSPGSRAPSHAAAGTFTAERDGQWPSERVARTNAGAAGTFIERASLELLEAAPGFALARMVVEPFLLGSNGYLHGGAVATLADTACGWGTRASLPKGARGFVTIEFRTSFLGTARSGTLLCRARARHLGGRTQVWHAEVVPEGANDPIALFGCTQMVMT